MTPPDPFTPIPLFSFPLFTSVVAGWEEHQAPLLEHVHALRRDHPGVVRSNRGAWHSGEEFLAHRSEHVAWLLTKVLKFARRALGRYHDGWSRHELVLAGSWANVLGRGGWNAPHHHFPCTWSGVFYVSVEDVLGRDGDPAGMVEFLSPTPWLSTFGQGGNFAYRPRNGLMLVFPASILHFVHPHDGERDRVSIAYNFNVVPRADQAGS